MNSDALTESLYLGAYALTNGARLKSIAVSRSNGRRTAVFELDGPEVQRLSAEFYDRSAVVNLAEYRRHLEALKDALFTALNQTKTQRETLETHRQGRARGAQAPR